jgi:mannitol/fructose-specific phosphotransferase system IIA component
MQWHHPIAVIWEMTPRQAFAWLAAGIARRKRERAELIYDMALAAQGKSETIERIVRELSDA